MLIIDSDSQLSQTFFHIIIFISFSSFILNMLVFFPYNFPWKVIPESDCFYSSELFSNFFNG